MSRLLWVTLVLGLVAILVLASRDDALRPDVAAILKQPPEIVPRDRNLFFGIIGAASRGDEPISQRGQALWKRYDAAAATPDRRLFDLSDLISLKDDAKLLCDSHGDPDHPSCSEKIRAHAAEVRTLLDDNVLLIDRYEQLRAFPEFQNLLENRIDGEILPWQSLLNGRKLLFARIVLDSPTIDVDPALRDWLTDMSFWRRFFAQANEQLLDKMVATAGVKGDFILAGELLRQGRLSPAQIAQMEIGMTPFEGTSLALMPALAGELRAQVQAVESLRGAGLNELLNLKDPLPGWLSHGLARFFYLPNATINAQYDAMFESLAARDGPNCAAPAAVKPAKAGRPKLRSLVYNPIGKIMVDISGPSFDTYVDRLCDLEGLRRILVVHARVRAAGLGPQQVPAFLASTPAELHDPYTGEPIAWDAQAAGFRFSARDKRTQNVLPWKL